MSIAPPIRLTVVMTHPVQYVAPWFRWIATHRPDVELTVLYGAMPTPEQQGTGFGRAFSWDVPVTDGYRSVVCGDAAGKRFGDHDLFGVDVPDIGDRIAATNPDIVLVPGWHSALQLRALRACRRLGIPVLYRGDSTLHGGPRRLLRPLWRLKTRLMLRQFDGYLSVGSLAREYLRAFDVPEPLIATSPHCVDNARFASEAQRLRAGERGPLRAAIGASDADFVVLFAGKLQPIKCPLDAVRAVATLGPHALLMTAGDGALGDQMRAEASRLGVRLAWRGFLNQSEMPAAFAASDCLLLPSASETWGLIVNEALASGLPCVVTSRVGAAPDLIVEGATGYTVPAGDVNVMGARLRDVRAARERGHDFTIACVAQVATCGFDAATAGLVAMSRRVLARRQAVRAASMGSPRVVECCGHMVSVFGLERMAFEVLRILRAHGVPVHCIVNRWDSARIVTLAEDIGASWSTGYYWCALKRRGWTPLQIAKAAWDVLCTSGGLLRVVRRTRATHVVVPDYGVVLRNAPALACLRLAGVPVVFRLGNAPDEGTFYRRLWRWVIGPLVSQFVVNSRFTATALASTGVPERKIRMIYNAPPSRTAAPIEETRRDHTRVVYIGQMIPPKGPHLLLDAVGELVRRGHDVTLDAIGDIDGWEPEGWVGYRQRLRDRAGQPDLRGRVRFLGLREDVPELLASAGIHCCPSQAEIREGFGVVNIEAKMAGIPSVVTPYGALPEIVEHRRDGWICRDGSAEALMEGLEYFLLDRARLEEAGRVALASYPRFSRERFAASWLDVFSVPLNAPGHDVAPDSLLRRHAH